MPRDTPCKSDLTRPGPLEALILRRIRAGGPITFGTFMRAALYEPGLGYYTSDRTVWGRDGDYLTAPGVHPVLGWSVARLARELDAEMGCPDPFHLVEVGCGEGRLSAAAVASLRNEAPALWERLRVVLVEAGTEARQRALARLEPPPGGIVAAASIEALDEGGWEGLVYSNELFDAFPVERVRRRSGVLEQSWVIERGGRLAESFRKDPTRSVAGYLERNEVQIREGQTVEVCPQVEDWMEAMADRLARGGLLTVDYGHETETLFGSERPDGTLVTMRRFTLGDDPLADPGERDITTHVDFGNLRRLAHARGFTGGDLCSLRVFLIGMGAAAFPTETTADRLAIRHLLVSEIGEQHKVMWLTRGLSGPNPVVGRSRLEPPAP